MGIKIKPRQQREAQLRRLARGLRMRGAGYLPLDQVLAYVTGALAGYRRRLNRV